MARNAGNAVCNVAVALKTLIARTITMMGGTLLIREYLGRTRSFAYEIIKPQVDGIRAGWIDSYRDFEFYLSFMGMREEKFLGERGIGNQFVTGTTGAGIQWKME